ncbi:MAG: outer membrane lipoprotein carrier protein LolA [Acidobacteria bacterium]|nr:MAG: outer membrane lipoprotein carrier protein LolA [Acidobacteriota bacterium]
MKEKFRTNNRRGRQHFLVASCAMWIALVMSSSLLASPPSDANLPLDKFITEVQNSYRDVEAIRADFTQTYDTGGAGRVESGTVVFARGGRMRWDYREPEKKVFLSNKKEVLLYLPEQGQLNRSSVKQSEDFRIPFRLLLSRLDLRKVFSRFEDANNQFQHPPEDRVIIAYPENADKTGYRHVVMEFDPQMNIRRLVIVYTNDTVMKFNFSHIDRNPRPAAALFELKPPAGTQIINHQ